MTTHVISHLRLNSSLPAFRCLGCAKIRNQLVEAMELASSGQGLVNRLRGLLPEQHGDATARPDSGEKWRESSELGVRTNSKLQIGC